jgi:hypothetical protein
VQAINENAISNVLVDVDFLEEAFKRIGRSHLTNVFGELRSVGPLAAPYWLWAAPSNRGYIIYYIDDLDRPFRHRARISGAGGSKSVIS